MKIYGNIEIEKKTRRLQQIIDAISNDRQQITQNRKVYKPKNHRYIGGENKWQIKINIKKK